MPDALDEVLRQAQDLGLVGPGPTMGQRRHAEAFCHLALAGLERDDGLHWIDLGSGGGLPGLVMAELLRDADPRARGTLLDSRQRSAAFLERAAERLNLTDRIEIVTARAEDAARDPEHRERYDLVLARSFGPPAVTAECATAFLRHAARLVISEPPERDPCRWDEAGLRDVALSPPRFVGAEGTNAAVFEKRGPTPGTWPRKAGIPQKRPLW